MKSTHKKIYCVKSAGVSSSTLQLPGGGRPRPQYSVSTDSVQLFEYLSSDTVAVYLGLSDFQLNNRTRFSLQRCSQNWCDGYSQLNRSTSRLKFLQSSVKSHGLVHVQIALAIVFCSQIETILHAQLVPVSPT